VLTWPVSTFAVQAKYELRSQDVNIVWLETFLNSL
jgi:hypothetical protein